MFCYQCQEAAKNEGCTVRGVCGKPEETAGLQDLFIHTMKGIAWYARRLGGDADERAGRFITKGLFATITNANFDDDRFYGLIAEGMVLRDGLKAALAAKGPVTGAPDAAVWFSRDRNVMKMKAARVGVLSTPNADVRSLREFLVYGLKGIAAYTHHAEVLGHNDPKIWAFLIEAKNSTLENHTLDEMTGLLVRAGETAVAAMAVLDRANTSAYGNPEITTVNIGVRENPGILISGHDLKDMEELLRQTEGSGVDVYTHSEMLPANYYPAFKKYKHFAGNYGNAWWKQDKKFSSFNGPVLMTTNCIVPVRDAYRNRIFTTGMAGYPGVKHIPDREEGGAKDFSEIIALAGTCASPQEIETGTIVGGFAHAQVLALADKVVDAGQCNDSYSLALIALKLKEVFGLDDINDLPISYDIAWYEQKAVAVLLALLFLGVRGIRLGPTLPAFVSPNVAKVLVEKFAVRQTSDPRSDIGAMLAGN